MLTRARHAERGQTLPVWVMGVVATLGIMFFALNYGNAVRYQIRAQNAADAAAQNVAAIQTERWNLMIEMLYASNVEEYRVRRLLDGMLLSIDDSGYCQTSYGDVTGFKDNFANGQCAETYNTLRTAFMRSVNRYSQDVGALNNVTALNTQANFKQDATALIAKMQSACNQTGVALASYATVGGDCAFKLTFPTNALKGMTGLYDVEDDAYGDLVPGLGRYPSNSSKIDTENVNYFQPMAIEVDACAKVPPLIPNFGPLHAPTFYAVARGAAQTVQFVQDWFEPGALTDPAISPNNYFQPNEIYNGQQPNATPTQNPWYDVQFGGNAALATSYQGKPFFAEPFSYPEMSARTGWWNAIPVKPNWATFSQATACP